MLRFNRRDCAGYIWTIKISIHPMLRFNLKEHEHVNVHQKFQYILCYGSTSEWCRGFRFCFWISIHPMLRFNCFDCSYEAYRGKFQYILCYGSTVRVGTRLSNSLKFQYILCYGSTLLESCNSRCLSNFNTSYVTVQQAQRIRTACRFSNLNTSYVTVQRNLHLNFHYGI